MRLASHVLAMSYQEWEHTCPVDNVIACLYPAYEDDDELLWNPGSLPESKVRGFLSEVSSRTTDEKAGCDKPGIHMRDNERVSTVLTNYPSSGKHNQHWNCNTPFSSRPRLAVILR